MTMKHLNWPLAGLAWALSMGTTAIAAPAELIAHEWGTFTSVQGSDGVNLQGLQHEETELPAFVYGRNHLNPTGSAKTYALPLADSTPRPTPYPTPDWPTHPCHGKCFEAALRSDTPTAVTQKLETPVIYFYTQQPQHVSVNVKFPGGVISQWYPDASTFSPEIGKLEALKNGTMNWELDVHSPKATLPIPPVSPEDIWAPSRNVHSNYVSANGENEKFLFYRGLGRFDVPFRVRSQGDSLFVENESKYGIPNAFLIRLENGKGLIKHLGSIGSGSTLTLSLSTLPAPERTFEEYLNQISTQLVSALVQSGLYEDEAHAMVNTWSKSYFKTPGTRILYVLPRALTDTILPLQITPAPQQLVRTLVGRVEILSETEEHVLESQLAQASTSAKRSAILESLGRFAEPKLRRVNEVSHSPAVRENALRLLRSVE